MRREDATHGAGQKLPAHMSGENLRCEKGMLDIWRRMRFLCAHVNGAGRQAGGGRAERQTGQGCLVVIKLHPARNRQESKIKRFYGQY